MHPAKTIPLLLIPVFTIFSCKKDKSTKKATTIDIQIAAGGYHSLIIKSDYTLWATGKNTEGQLGDGTTNSRNTFGKIMDSIKAISVAGFHHSLFLKADNSLWVAGWNFSGQLGDGTNASKTRPAKIMNDVKTMTAGVYKVPNPKRFKN